MISSTLAELLGTVPAPTTKETTSMSEWSPATALAAIVALIVGLVAVIQKSRADRRDQWWKRAQWAIEQTFVEDKNEEQRALGFRVLQVLADSRLAAREELQVLESLTTIQIAPLAPDASEGDHGERREEGDPT